MPIPRAPFGPLIGIFSVSITRIGKYGAAAVDCFS